MAIERSDQRHPQGRKTFENPVTVTNPAVAKFLGLHAAPCLDIATGRKALPLARQDRHTDRIVCLHLIGGRHQRAEHIKIESIAFFRPRYRHDRDVAVDLDANRAISHGRFPPARGRFLSEAQGRYWLRQKAKRPSP
ncbi:hypothetical protein D3C87_1663650 [compost metagenome]